MAENKPESEKNKNDKSNEGTKAEAVTAVKSNTKLLIIIGAVLFVIVIAGVGLFLLKSSEKQETHEEVSADAAKHSHDFESQNSVSEGEDELDEGEEILGSIFPLETFIVNLADGRYIRIQIQLEFRQRDIPKRFYTRLIIIRDGIINLLANKNEKDLLSTSGRDGLKEDVKVLVNEALRKEEVKRVYFTQFVIQ